MDFQEFMAMMAGEVDKYRDYFPAQTQDNQQAMTSCEYAARSGGFSVSAHLTADGKISDSQTGVYVSFSIRPAVPSPGL